MPFACSVGHLVRAFCVVCAASAREFVEQEVIPYIIVLFFFTRTKIFSGRVNSCRTRGEGGGADLLLWSYPTKVFHSTDKLGLKGRNSGRPGRDTCPGVAGRRGCVYGPGGALVRLHCVGCVSYFPRAQNTSALLAPTTVLDAAPPRCVSRSRRSIRILWTSNERGSCTRDDCVVPHQSTISLYSEHLEFFSFYHYERHLLTVFRSVHKDALPW